VRGKVELMRVESFEVEMHLKAFDLLLNEFELELRCLHLRRVECEACSEVESF
jgi:hypothetical protein